MRWPARWRRPLPVLRDVALLAVVGYIAAAAYLYAYQVDIVFRPPARGAILTASLGLAPERVTLTDADGLASEAWKIKPPAQPSSGLASPIPYWILYLHGNAASISTSVNQRRYDQLRGLGVNLLAVEYPGFGEVGGVASEDGMHAAARAGYEYLRHVEGVAPANLAIYGWSLGTGAAVPLARDVDEAALIVEGGFTSVLDRGREEHPFMPVAFLLLHPFRSDQAIAATHSPTLFLHSRSDTIVPYRHGEAMFARAANPKRFVTLEGGHIYDNAVDADRYAAGIHEFLAEVVHWQVRTPKPSAGVAVAKALASGGVDAALATWRHALAEGDAKWSVAEYELQHVARTCTLEGRHAEAIALFRANRDRFPDSPLAWYELGRALAAASDPVDARRALLRSLALEPEAINPSHAALAALPH
jgi:fermentation-respiration switch protein FrsA (DUF1100 family)